MVTFHMYFIFRVNFSTDLGAIENKQGTGWKGGRRDGRKNGSDIRLTQKRNLILFSYTFGVFATVDLIFASDNFQSL